jgi:DNA-binding response OmpR family regulator
MLPAHTKALGLLRSDDKWGLHHWLERWRDRKEECDISYVLAVVNAYAIIASQATQPDIALGKLVLKLDQQRAEWDGVDVNLTVTEFRIVKLFTDHLGEFLSYRAIYDVVRYVGFAAGCGNDGYKGNVRSCIKRLRHKFIAVSPGWDEIENYGGMGYRWRQSTAKRVQRSAITVDQCAGAGSRSLGV